MLTMPTFIIEFICYLFIYVFKMVQEVQKKEKGYAVQTKLST